MPRTTADVPPGAASEFKRAPRPTAISDADATGYAPTPPMKKAQVKGSNQYGLPKSTGAMRKVKMKG